MSKLCVDYYTQCYAKQYIFHTTLTKQYTYQKYFYYKSCNYFQSELYVGITYPYIIHCDICPHVFSRMHKVSLVMNTAQSLILCVYI